MEANLEILRPQLDHGAILTRLDRTSIIFLVNHLTLDDNIQNGNGVMLTQKRKTCRVIIDRTKLNTRGLVICHNTIML